MRLLAVILIALAGLALRVDAAWQGAPKNMPDSAAYERIARGLHEEGEFVQKGDGTPAHPQSANNYSPGLPLAVSGVFFLAGDDDVRLARILLALVASLAIPFTWLLARRLAPAKQKDLAAIAATAIVAFYPCLIADAGVLLTETLAGTLITGSLLAMLRARDHLSDPNRSRLLKALDWFLPGVLLGLTAMVRPEYLPIGLVLIATLAVLTRDFGVRQIAMTSGLMLLALALTLLPWTIRSFDQTGRVVPLSTGGGQTLFTGSYLASGGDPLEVMPSVLARNPEIDHQIYLQNRASGEGERSITPERVLGLLAEQHHPGVPTDIALGRMGRENYQAALREDPFGLAGYLVAKSARIWWRGRTDLTGTTVGRAFHMTLIAAALAGMIMLGLRHRPEFWLLLALAVGVTLVGMLLVASPRRTLAIWPVISCLGGIGIAAAFNLARDSLTSRSRSVPIA